MPRTTASDARPIAPSPATPDRRTDEALVTACLHEDPTAWPELIERYGRLVYSIATQWGLDPIDAEDVFQEVFAALLRRLPTIRNRQGIGKWLITTTRHFCLQNRGARRPSVQVDLRRCAAPEDEADAMRLEREQRLHSALRQLGGRCEELLRLLYAGPDGLAYEQIAAILDIPVGSIGPTRARCLAKLLDLLEPEPTTPVE